MSAFITLVAVRNRSYIDLARMIKISNLFLALKSLGVSFAIIGSVLWMFGKDLELIASNLNIIQRYGIALLFMSLIIVALFSLRYDFLNKKRRQFNYIDLPMATVTLVFFFIDILWVFGMNTINNRTSLALLYFGNCFAVSYLLVHIRIYVISIIEKMKNTVEKPSERLTIIVAAGSAVVALIAVLKS